MNPLHLPWVEIAVAVALLGALIVSQVRDAGRAALLGWLFTGAALLAALLAWLAFQLGIPAEAQQLWSVQPALFGRILFGLDELNAPLLPMVALLHFLTGLATARTKMRRFSASWSLATEAVRLATFACLDPSVLVGLLIAGTVPPYVELVNRGRPTRVYVLHMSLFAGLLLLGWAFLEPGAGPSAWAALPLMGATLVRCGTVPVHCWVTDWFEHASFGIALLFVAPLAGVYAAVRLVLPVAPDWVLQGIGVVSLATAVYAAGMAIIQREARRFFAYLFISHASLVLVGLELHTELSLTAALCLWFSVTVALGGFGLTLRAIEARYGRLSLDDYHGLYESSPTLAVCFLLTGLASVGFPGTLGFVSAELLVEGAVTASPWVGVGVVAAAALNGIAVVRAFFRLFTGARHVSTVFLGIIPRERVAVLTLAALILLGGLFPQPGVASRERAAAKVLESRPPAPPRLAAEEGVRAPNE